MHRTELHFPSILTNSTNIRAHTEIEAAGAAVSSKSRLPGIFDAVEDEELRKVLMAFAKERKLHRKPMVQVSMAEKISKKILSAHLTDSQLSSVY